MCPGVLRHVNSSAVPYDTTTRAQVSARISLCPDHNALYPALSAFSVVPSACDQ
jgi:hypothetical protein